MNLDGRSGDEPAPSLEAGKESIPNGRRVPQNPMWIISLHVAACRRWLGSEPPRIAEADASLRTIEAFGDCTVLRRS